MNRRLRPSFPHPVAGVVLAFLVCAAPGSPALRAADDVFVKNCAPCHGPDGRARTPVARRLGVKDLTVSKVTDEEIVKSIQKGRPDKSGKLVMPSFGDKVSPAEIEALVKTVKALRK
jgi:mono/diheme cytochrome c family protein